jgi:RHS repeat-associated protein
MQLSSGTQIPDGILAAIALRNENSRLGVPSKNPALHQGIDASKMQNAMEFQSSISTTCIRSRCTGKERDAESGNDYFGARYYGSSMGRWMSPDWADFPDAVPYANTDNPQSLNLYAYVLNNPLSQVDDDGHDCVVQSRTSNTTENVSVSTGNCDNVSVGDGQSKTYVPGTVTGISVNGGNSIDIGYNSYDGQSSGVTNAGGAPIPDNPGLAYNWGNNAQGYQQLGAASTFVNRAAVGYAIAFGAVGGAIVATDAIAGYGLTTLAGEDGLGLTGNQAINRMIGSAQRELLKDFFKSGKLPEGLSQRTLQLYKEVAQRAIAAGKDQLGVQAQRLAQINSVLH